MISHLPFVTLYAFPLAGDSLVPWSWSPQCFQRGGAHSWEGKLEMRSATMAVAKRLQNVLFVNDTENQRLNDWKTLRITFLPGWVTVRFVSCIGWQRPPSGDQQLLKLQLEKMQHLKERFKEARLWVCNIFESEHFSLLQLLHYNGIFKNIHCGQISSVTN